MSTTLKRLAMSVQPSLRGRVFALLAGLTICACAGATATYWLAQHYLYATDILRQVNLSQQVGALSFSEQLSGLEADALAARLDPQRRKDFKEHESAIAMALKKKAKERRAADVAAATSHLYAQLVSALSKHDAIVRDLAALPAGATGGIVIGGVYGGR